MTLQHLRGNEPERLYLYKDIHDEVIKWKLFPRYWPFVRGIHRSQVNSPHKGQWRGALMFSLIGAWINGWVNNHEAGDLRSHRAHYDVFDLTSNGDIQSYASMSIINRIWRRSPGVLCINDGNKEFMCFRVIIVRSLCVWLSHFRK